MGEGKAKVVMADVTAVERVWSNENETKFVGKSGCASLLPPPTHIRPAGRSVASVGPNIFCKLPNVHFPFPIHHAPYHVFHLFWAASRRWHQAEETHLLGLNSLGWFSFWQASYW